MPRRCRLFMNWSMLRKIWFACTALLMGVLSWVCNGPKRNHGVTLGILREPLKPSDWNCSCPGLRNTGAGSGLDGAKGRVAGLRLEGCLFENGSLFSCGNLGRKCLCGRGERCLGGRVAGFSAMVIFDLTTISRTSSCCVASMEARLGRREDTVCSGVACAATLGGQY